MQVEELTQDEITSIAQSYLNSLGANEVLAIALHRIRYNYNTGRQPKPVSTKVWKAAYKLAEGLYQD